MLLAKNAGVDLYVNISGVPMVFCSELNTFFDQVYNLDWLAMELQVQGFNYLIPIGTKIPQTTDGIAGLKNAYQQVLIQAVNNGVLAPGTWTAAVPPGIPQALFLSNMARVGYYTWSTPIGQQLPADRVARKAPLIQIAVKLAGAVHSSNVLVQVNE
jgi:hypothetical protein